MKLLRIYLVLCIFLSLITSANSFAAEIKIAYKGSSQRNETGSSFDLEFAGKPITKFKLSPLIGVSVNTGKSTHYGFVGLQFRKDFSSKFYFDISLGGAVTFNKPITKTNKKRRALGSRLLFRESIALGMYINDSSSIALYADHISNANIVPPNHGATYVGARLAYHF